MNRKITVKRDKEGIFFARPYLGTNVITGKRIRPYKRFPDAKTQEEAETMAQEWVNTLSAASDLHVTMKLSDVLFRYIQHIQIENKSPNTYKTYTTCATRYVNPYIGDVAVDKVEAYMIDSLYHILLLHGKMTGDALSPNTVIKVHWFLSGAFKWFVFKNLCASNPVDAVTPPDDAIIEAVAYDEEEFNRLSNGLAKMLQNPAADDDKAIFEHNAAFAAFVSLYTGGRLGEVLALRRRKDVILPRKLVCINATMVEQNGLHRKPKPKGKRSRNISIGSTLCNALQDHYRWQDTFLKSKRGDIPVCCNSKGEYLRPSDVSRYFSDVLRPKFDLPEGTSFHTLRHTHATWLLLQGVDIRTIKERLGHARIETTLSLYTHVMPGRDAEAARVFDQGAAGMGGIE